MNDAKTNVANKHLIGRRPNVESNADRVELQVQKFAETNITANYSQPFQKLKAEIESDSSLLENDAPNNEPVSEHEYELKRALRQSKRTSPAEDGIPFHMNALNSYQVPAT